MDVRKEFGTTARIEAAATLYYQRYRKLAPGKDVAVASDDSETQEERFEQYQNWQAMHAYSDALNRICQLEERLELLGDDDALGAMAAHVNNVLTVAKCIPELWRSDMDKAIIRDAETALAVHRECIDGR